MDIRSYNRDAWNRQVDEGTNPWTLPVSAEIIAAARRGDWQIVLTPTIPVPREWYPRLEGLEVLCLASGGGQQGPVLAAAGARVTVLDNSPRMLDQDRMVAEREGLAIRTVEGDMRDLSMFADESFGLVVHPVSNVFVPEVLPVWREAYRVLKPGGALLAGVTNPVLYVFDSNLHDQGILQVRHALPYADPESLLPEELEDLRKKGWPMEFSHTFEDQIGGQLAAGFVLTGFFEDRDPRMELSKYMATFFATRAVKLAGDKKA